MPSSLAVISITVALVALIDYIPRLFVKAKKSYQIEKSRSKIPNYYIMPTVYGDISYLKNIKYLKKYRKRIVICTSKYETEAFYKDLRRICRANGFRYITADVPLVNGQPIKNAYTIYAGVFTNLGNLKANTDTPCLLIDADTFSKHNTNDLIRTFIKTNLHMASLRCEVNNPKNTIQILQEFEYKLAMDNRKMDSWLTSGACNIAVAGVYKKVFCKHSSYFAGGDIEIGKIASVMGFRVGHINTTFLTDAPDSLKEWYAQRIIWFAGGFRHHVINIASFGWYHFFMLFYNSILIYLLLPLRWIEMINYPATLLLMLGVSWFYTFTLLAGRAWRKEYLLLPFYSFFQTMWVVPRAFVAYVLLARQHRSLGRISYDLTNKLKRTRLAFSILNITSAGLVILFVLLFSYIRIDYWAHNKNGYLTRVVSYITKN